MDFVSTYKGENPGKYHSSLPEVDFEATTHFHEIIGSNEYTHFPYFPLPKDYMKELKKQYMSLEPHVVNPCPETPKRSIQSVSYQMDDEDVFPQSCKVCTDLGF